MNLERITIEGMNNISKKSYDLSNINYLYGTNGSGKTTVLQAIQLALLGYTNVSGKRVSGVFNHANSHTLAVTLQLSGGVTIQRVFTKTRKSIDSSVTTTPEDLDIEQITRQLELPIFNFADLMSSTANSQKDWWMKFLPSVSVDIDWNKELTESLGESVFSCKEDYIQESIQFIDKLSQTAVKGSDMIREVNEYFKSELADSKKEQTRLTSIYQSLVHYDMEEDVDCSDVDSKIDSLNQELVQLLKYLTISESNQSRLAYLQDRVDDTTDVEQLKSNIQKLSQKLKELEDRRQSVATQNAAYRNLLSRINELKSEIQEVSVKLENSSGVCPFTHEVCKEVPVTVDVDALSSELSKLKEKHEQLLEEQSRFNVQSSAELENEIYRCQVQLDEHNRTLNDYNALNAQLAELKKLTKPEGLQFSTETEYRNELARLIDIKSKIEANNKYNELSEQVNKDLMRCEERISMLTEWIKLTGVNGLQNKYMMKPFETFAEDMYPLIHRVFGNDVNPKFILSEKSNDFSLGIERNGTYIPYNMLSSGEKCLFALSMMIAVTSIHSSLLKLILVDDMFDHVDKHNLSLLFDFLTTVTEVQFVFAGVASIPTSVKDEVNIIQIKS